MFTMSCKTAMFLLMHHGALPGCSMACKRLSMSSQSQLPRFGAEPNGWSREFSKNHLKYLIFFQSLESRALSHTAFGRILNILAGANEECGAETGPFSDFHFIACRTSSSVMEICHVVLQYFDLAALC